MIAVEGSNLFLLGVVVLVVKLYENQAFTTETQCRYVTFSLMFTSYCQVTVIGEVVNQRIL